MLLCNENAMSDTGYTINNSLRFRSTATAYLDRTFLTPTSQNVYTLSMWVKRGILSTTQNLFGASTNHSLGFNTSNQLVLTINGTAYTSTTILRDPTGWYHIVYRQNGTTYTVYVNNVTVLSGTSVANTAFNTAIMHQIAAANTLNFFDGALAEINFVDGQALTPSSFGQTNPATSVWTALKYVGTYGNNGFYLEFSNTSSVSNLGLDYSGNREYIQAIDSDTDTSGFNNSVTLDKGAGRAGDIAIATVVYGTAVTVNSFTPPTGWTTVNSTANRGIFYKVLDGTEGSTFTFSITYTGSVFDLKSSGVIAIYRYATSSVIVGTLGVETINPIAPSITLTGTRNAIVASASSPNIGTAIIYSRTGFGAGLAIIFSTSFPDIALLLNSLEPAGATGDLTFSATGSITTSAALLFGLTATNNNANNNNWTVNNVSLTATTNLTASYDALIDSPTPEAIAEARPVGNYCIGNPLDRTTTFSLVNANIDTTSGIAQVVGNIPMTSGKWYWEFNVSNTTDSYQGGVYGTTVTTYTIVVQAVNGVRFDRDTGVLERTTNGSTWSTVATGLTTGAYYAFFASITNARTMFINFGQRPFSYTVPTGYQALCTTNLPSTTITTSGTFTGNANANGPFVYLNGTPTAMTINGNAVTWGTHADKLANGFKIRTALTTYNSTGTNTYSVTTTGAPFKYALAQGNP